MSRVLIPLAPGFEDMEAVILIDLLRRAAINVTVVGLAPGPVTGARGTVVFPDLSVPDILNKDFDMMVLPGGQPGASNLAKDERILELLRKMAGAGKYTAAICAAPGVLAQAGLLDGRKATAYPGTLTAETWPKVEAVDVPVVVDGKIITSRGPGTAIDFGLQLIETLTDKATRDKVESALLRP